jgi:DNA-binding MarR family transcriptional regulator
VGSDDYADKLEAEKAKSTLQLLFKAARLLNERAIARVRSRTKQPVRVAHTSLLPHVDLEGTRLTELARRLGVTKQAAGQLVDELVEMGVLERVPDPADARAKLVRFSKQGRVGLLEGLAVLKELEEDVAAIIGDATMRTLHETLVAIVRSYGEGATMRGEITAERGRRASRRRRR